MNGLKHTHHIGSGDYQTNVRAWTTKITENVANADAVQII
jgi:hypothetical protein